MIRNYDFNENVDLSVSPTLFDQSGNALDGTASGFPVGVDYVLDGF